MVLSHRLELVLRTLLKPSSTILKLSAFPAILPFVYQKLLPLVKQYSDKYEQEITALLSSPVTLLLPHGLRVYLALYAITSAMTTFFKGASPKDQARKIEEGRAGEKEWRDYLPPVRTCPELQFRSVICTLLVLSGYRAQRHWEFLDGMELVPREGRLPEELRKTYP